MTDEEIDAVKLGARKTLELTQFVGACEIDPRYLDKSYWVVPQDESAEVAFRVLRDAPRETEKVALERLVIRGYEYLAAIKACGKDLLLEPLHYEDEIRKSDPYFSGVSEHRVQKDLLAVSTELIKRKTAAFDASTYKDHYREALREVIDTKLKSRGKKTEITTRDEPAPAGGGENVIDLISALKSSLKKSEGGSRSAKSTAKSSAKTTSMRKKAS